MIKPLRGIAAVAFIGTTSVVGAVVVTSSGGTEEAVQVQQSASPSTLPTLTPSPRPSAIPSPSPATPTPSASSLTPTPASGGQAPGGCVSGELVYQDPAGRFAFCYPADMQLGTDTGPTSAVHGIAAGVRYPLDGEADSLAVSLVWQSTPSSIDGRPCTSGEFIVKEERGEPCVISGLSGQACV